MAGNPVTKQAGIERRNHIVELIEADIDNGGDGLTRAELAATLGITKPTLHRQLMPLFEDGRIRQIGPNLLPSTTGHIHICRTCGQIMH